MAGTNRTEYFFAPHYNGTLNKEIVNKLTAIRIEDYSVLYINRLEDSELEEIKAMVLELGINVLKENTEDATEFPTAKSGFVKSIDLLSDSKSKFAFVSYAAQLLQYYTIICDKSSVVGMNGSEFQKFLKDNTDKFGDTSKNLFITEYRLTKYYNELVAFQNTPDNISSSQINIILEQLNQLTSQVEKWTEDAPYNIFVRYLDFIAFYTCAKALEIQFLKDAPTATDEEKIFISDSQSGLIKLAQNALTSMDSVTKQAKDGGDSNLLGLEFSFGQNVLRKLPSDNLEQIKGHVSSLLT